MNSHTVFDVVIVGAGPAGCTAALALQGSGLSVALLEKGRFPRDKVCGDAIPGPAFKTLYELNPDWGEQLFALKAQQRIYESEFVLSKDRGLGMEWKMKTYNARRLDFDNHLWEMVQQHTETKTYEDTFVKSITPKDNGVVLHTARQQSFFAKVIIGADGANGVTARQLAGYRLNRAHHCAAVRAYYRNVDHLEPNKNLFFTQKKFLPGYFWIFPLPNGEANVGLGMRSDILKKRKVNLR
ncbi:MAG: FAD-dependent oxidoreductase, partial [Bacteroidota bacterium]